MPTQALTQPVPAPSRSPLLPPPSLITGAGPIGIVALLCASAAGASPIVITDLIQDRLDFAKKLVPDVLTYRIDTNKTPRECAREIVRLFSRACGVDEGEGEGQGEVMPAVSMECTGVESSVHTAACELRMDRAQAGRGGTAADIEHPIHSPPCCPLSRCDRTIRPGIRHWRRKGEASPPPP